ncbi:MAG: class II aldolase/adducin family protein [Albidovulum sp.]|nr:class II aldolase/adducin family protein [Albidovulum sp.]
MLPKLDENDVLARKLALIGTAKRSFDLRLQTNAGGNLSVRLACRDAIAIKPSGIGFNECTVDNLMIADLNGEILAGSGKPSKDLDFHAGIYRARPDVGAIVHVHSPWATGWASAGLEIPCITVQSIEKVGRVPLVPLGPNGGPQRSEDIVPAIEDRSVRAATLASHGTIGLGKTLVDAQYVVELLEETAQIAFVRSALAHAKGLVDIPAPASGLKHAAEERN